MDPRQTKYSKHCKATSSCKNAILCMILNSKAISGAFPEDFAYKLYLQTYKREQCRDGLEEIVKEYENFKRALKTEDTADKIDDLYKYINKQPLDLEGNVINSVMDMLKVPYAPLTKTIIHNAEQSIETIETKHSVLYQTLHAQYNIKNTDYQAPSLEELNCDSALTECVTKSDTKSTTSGIIQDLFTWS